MSSVGVHVRVRQECQDGIALLAVSGRVADDDAPGLLTVVETASVDQPLGVVVELGATVQVSDSAVSALRDAALHSGAWPRGSVVLCTADAGLATRLAPAAVFATCVGAVAHLSERADASGERVDLRHGLDGPAQARAVVAEWSERVGLEDVTDDLTLIVSEMVTNAVKHASPPVALEMHADGDRVVLAVRDGSPDEPEPRQADSEAEGGRGLLLVDLLSEEHGVLPNPPGKTVWAAWTRSRTARP